MQAALLFCGVSCARPGNAVTAVATAARVMICRLIMG
jgi:hypothetical protein